MTTSSDPRADVPVPLTILTGFLGAGKTTLLNRLLSGDHGLRVAALVNDFGAINIDAELVVDIEDDMISLANGCVCCEIRDDLVAAVDQLLESDARPEYVVLEASGVADPMGIWATFNDSRHRDRIRLDGVTCVVDADQIFEHFDEAPELVMLKARQIGTADLVVLNKVDLAGDAEIARVRTWIDGMMNRVRIIEATYCDVPLEVLLGAGRFDAVREVLGEEAEPPRGDPDDRNDHAHEHAVRSQFATFAYETDVPLELEALQEMIRRRLPGAVYRCKGIVHCADVPDHRVVLQSVGRRSEITTLDEWRERPRCTRIVAIGAAATLDTDALRAEFDACRTGTPVA